MRIKPGRLDFVSDGAYLWGEFCLLYIPQRIVAKTTQNVGLRLLGLWLLLYALVDLFALSFPYQSLILTVLALVAGVLLIVGS